MEEKENERGGKYDLILHEFYEKKMVTPRVISEGSALPERVKRETLSQEIIRIRRNTHESLREGTRKAQMSRFAWKLYQSGYNATKRREIVLSGLKGFEKLEDLDKRGIRSLNRSRREDFSKRMLRRHGAKKMWYKGKRQSENERERGKRGKKRTSESEIREGGMKKEETEAVMFVPPTPEGS